MSAQGEAFIKSMMQTGRRGPTNGAVVPITTGPQEPLEILADELPPERPRPTAGREIIVSYGPKAGTYVVIVEEQGRRVLARSVIDRTALEQVMPVLSNLGHIRDWTVDFGPAKPGQESAPTGAGTRRRARQGRPAPGAGGREPAGAGPEAV